MFFGGTGYGPIPARWQKGLYTEDVAYGVGDGLIMCFTKDHKLAWSTFYGGDENSFADIVWSLAIKDGDKLYATGTTFSAYNPDPMNPVFFPLSNPLNGSWYDEILDPVNDAFIASFCINGILTSVQNMSTQNKPMVLFFVDEQRVFRVSGLSVGNHHIVIYDAAGRMVVEEDFENQPIDVSDFPSGFYFVMLTNKSDSSQTILKFTKQ